MELFFRHFICGTRVPDMPVVEDMVPEQADGAANPLPDDGVFFGSGSQLTALITSSFTGNANAHLHQD